jgi:hypothetical protein
MPIEKQVSYPSCRYKNLLRFDFRVDGMLIEYQGEQHYRIGNYTKDQAINERIFEDCKIKDQIKSAWCKDNGIKLISIPYTMKREEMEEMLNRELVA